MSQATAISGNNPITFASDSPAWVLPAIIGGVLLLVGLVVWLIKKS